MNQFLSLTTLLLIFSFPAFSLAQDKTPKIEVVVAAHQYEFYGDVLKVLNLLEKHSLKDYRLTKSNKEGIFVSIVTNGNPKDSRLGEIAKAIGKLKVTVEIRGPIEQWGEFSNQRLESLGDKKTVILVRADWCGACQRLEKTNKVYQNAVVAEMIKDHDLQMLRLDMTNVQNNECQAFLDKLKIDAVPTLIVFAKGANRKPETLTCPIDPASMVKEIEKRLPGKE